VHDALKLLEEFKISGAPVLDKGKVLGFVDDMDLLCFLAKKVSEPTPISDITSSTKEVLLTLAERTREFKIQNVSALMGPREKFFLFLFFPF
jgi:CBS domain-containing protein